MAVLRTRSQLQNMLSARDLQLKSKSKAYLARECFLGYNPLAKYRGL